jgi:hypothetical protein
VPVLINADLLENGQLLGLHDLGAQLFDADVQVASLLG